VLDGSSSREIQLGIYSIVGYISARHAGRTRERQTRAFASKAFDPIGDSRANFDSHFRSSKIPRMMIMITSDLAR